MSSLAVLLIASPLAAARPTEAADVQAIRDQGALWSRLYAAGDIVRLRSLYEPDAWLMTEGQPAYRGVDAILAFLERNAASGAKTSFAVDPEQIVIDGDRAFLISKYRMTVTPPRGAAVTAAGRSMLVFKRHAGTWRIWRDMDNRAADAGFAR